jgi:hypothetical protein
MAGIGSWYSVPNTETPSYHFARANFDIITKTKRSRYNYTRITTFRIGSVKIWQHLRQTVLFGFFSLESCEVLTELVFRQYKRMRMFRVTRLGEFTPIGRLFSLCSFFPGEQCIFILKKRVGLCFGRVFSPTHLLPKVQILVYKDS